MPHPLSLRAASNNLEPPAGLTEEMMERLVREFYGAARKNPLLGPIFAERLEGRYEGRPLPAHASLGLDPAHFTIWLALFETTARKTLPPEGADYFIARAHRIAESFQLGLNIGDKAVDFRAAQRRREPE